MLLQISQTICSLGHKFSCLFAPSTILLYYIAHFHNLSSTLFKTRFKFHSSYLGRFTNLPVLLILFLSLFPRFGGVFFQSYFYPTVSVLYVLFKQFLIRDVTRTEVLKAPAIIWSRDNDCQDKQLHLPWTLSGITQISASWKFRNMIFLCTQSQKKSLM